MAKKETNPTFDRDLSRTTLQTPEALRSRFGFWLDSNKMFKAEGISDLDGALQAGILEVAYHSSMAKDQSGQDVYAWITRDQAKAMGQVFQNKSIDLFELQYSTWEPGAFGDFLNEIKAANSKVRQFVLSCHTGDEFTREQGSYLADLIPAWGIEKLEIHSNEFLPEALDELCQRLEKSGYTQIKDIKLKGHRTIGKQREKGPDHAGLKALCQKNKQAAS